MPTDDAAAAARERALGEAMTPVERAWAIWRGAQKYPSGWSLEPPPMFAAAFGHGSAATLARVELLQDAAQDVLDLSEQYGDSWEVPDWVIDNLRAALAVALGDAEAINAGVIHSDA